MKKHRFLQITSLAVCSLTIGVASPLFAAESVLLGDVLRVAQELDPQIKRSELNQQAMEYEAKANSHWQDPRVSLAVANVPIESFDLDQEPMTQIVLGVTQMLPRGNSLKLRRERTIEHSKIEELTRQKRIAESTRDITILWLDAFREQEKIRIIEKNRKFFVQLSELSSASYISTRGQTRQQHLIRTELEIMKLDEKLQRFTQSLDSHIQGLNMWLLSGEDSATRLELDVLDNPRLQLDANSNNLSSDSIQNIVALHPEATAIEQLMRSTQKSIALSREVGKAAWGVNAKYGYREGDREDFFSLGVSVDVPINRSKKSQQLLSAALQKNASIKQKHREVLRTLQSDFQQFQSQIQHLNTRQEHYRQQILTQMRVEAESAQNAYISDEGDLQDVVRALIGELNAELDELHIDIERQKYIAKLQYLMEGKPS